MDQNRGTPSRIYISNPTKLIEIRFKHFFKLFKKCNLWKDICVCIGLQVSAMTCFTAWNHEFPVKLCWCWGVCVRRQRSWDSQTAELSRTRRVFQQQREALLLPFNPIAPIFSWRRHSIVKTCAKIIMDQHYYNYYYSGSYHPQYPPQQQQQQQPQQCHVQPPPKENYSWCRKR